MSDEISNKRIRMSITALKQRVKSYAVTLCLFYGNVTGNGLNQENSFFIT